MHRGHRLFPETPSRLNNLTGLDLSSLLAAVTSPAIMPSVKSSPLHLAASFHDIEADEVVVCTCHPEESTRLNKGHGNLVSHIHLTRVYGGNTVVVLLGGGRDVDNFFPRLDFLGSGSWWTRGT